MLKRGSSWVIELSGWVWRLHICCLWHPQLVLCGIAFQLGGMVTHDLVGYRCVLVCMHIRRGAGSGAALRNAVSQVCQYCCGSSCLH